MAYAQADQEAPDFYTQPKPDNEEHLYAYAEGITYEEAFVLAFSQMAMKIESKVQAVQKTETMDQSAIKGGTTKSLAEPQDSVFVSNMKTVSNESFGDINVQSMQEMMQEESGGQFRERFESTIRLIFKKRKGGALMLNLNMMEDADGNFSYSLGKTEKGATFGDLISYINAHNLLDYTFATRWNNTGYVYYLELQCDLKLFEDKLNPKADEDDT